MFGGTLDRTVTWQNRSEVGKLAGTPERLRIVLTEADLCSLVFTP